MNGLNNIKFDKTNPKKGLLEMLNEILRLEKRASVTYTDILGNESLTGEARSIINQIQKEEEGHVKIAESMIKLIEDYDFKLEIMKF
jgi:rubrerythrin